MRPLYVRLAKMGGHTYLHKDGSGHGGSLPIPESLVGFSRALALFERS